MLKLVAEPIEQMDPMGALDGALGVVSRDVLLTGGGEAGALFERRLKAVTHQDDVTAPEVADGRCQRMDLDHSPGSILIRLHRLLVVVLGELARVGLQVLRAPSQLRLSVVDANQAVRLQPAADTEASGFGGGPDALGTVPTIEQDVGVGVGGRLETPDALSHQVTLAGKHHTLGFADRFLMIQLWRKWTATIGDRVERLCQAMVGQHPSLRRRVVLAQTFHLLATSLVAGRVIADEVNGHTGCLRTPRSVGPAGALLREQGRHLWGNLLTKAAEPCTRHHAGVPRCLCQKATQARHTPGSCDRAEEIAQCARVMTQEQRHQHNHEMPSLGAREALPEGSCILAHPLILAYNWYPHCASPVDWRVVTPVVPDGERCGNSPGRPSGMAKSAKVVCQIEKTKPMPANSHCNSRQRHDG